MKENIEKTIKERGSIYGNYKDTIVSRTKIMETLRNHFEKTNGFPMDLQTQVVLGDLVLKLVRVSASPKHSDSMHDISCYAKLIEDEIIKGDQK